MTPFTDTNTSAGTGEGLKTHLRAFNGSVLSNNGKDWSKQHATTQSGQVLSGAHMKTNLHERNIVCPLWLAARLHWMASELGMTYDDMPTLLTGLDFGDRTLRPSVFDKVCGRFLAECTDAQEAESIDELHKLSWTPKLSRNKELCQLTR